MALSSSTRLTTPANMNIIIRVLGLEHLDLKQTFNGTLIWSILLIALSQFNFGFEQQGFNTTQAMNQFAKKFGVYDTGKKRYELESWWLSLFTGLPYIGFGVGMLHHDTRVLRQRD